MNSQSTLSCVLVILCQPYPDSLTGLSEII